jgi:hypothetical protein
MPADLLYVEILPEQGQTYTCDFAIADNPTCPYA